MKFFFEFCIMCYSSADAFVMASFASFELERTLATINQSLITDLNMFLHLSDHN